MEVAQVRSPPSATTVNAFEVGDKVLLKHPFDPDLFDQLRPYYDPVAHRFEVPRGEFEAVRETLEAHSHRTVLVDVEEFCVVTRTGLTDRIAQVLKDLFAAHTYDPVPAENDYEFRDWRAQSRDVGAEIVLEHTRGGRRVRVLRDRNAVDRAIEEGATPISETEIDLSRVLADAK